MDRSRSDDHIAFGPETPWERTAFARLPRRGESEPIMPATERVRPNRNISVKAPQSTKRSVTQRPDVSRYRGTPPPEDSIRQHRVQGSLSAQASPRPYETACFLPEVIPIASSPPPYSSKALPLTPPESFDEKSSLSTDNSSPSKQIVHVLPGTMSSRNTRSKSSTRQRSGQRKKKPTKVNQWKVAFRQIFTKSPVDETQFEKIQSKHWTDE